MYCLFYNARFLLFPLYVIRLQLDPNTRLSAEDSRWDECQRIQMREGEIRGRKQTLPTKTVNRIFHTAAGPRGAYNIDIEKSEEFSLWPQLPKHIYLCVSCGDKPEHFLHK